MMQTTFIPPLFGLFGLLVAFIIFLKVMRYREGGEKVTKIAREIHLGAMVFMRREYTMLSIFAGVLVVLLFFSLGWMTTLAFIVGAITSGLAGFLGMFTATRANVRTTTAAYEDGMSAALSVAFFGGSVMGLAVASLGLLGLGSLYLFFGGDAETAHAIHGFGMGASTVALFSRVGGGIFTKSADVGADLVGKIEIGIPEDDPRNPGVIADNVGDNVGDVAGMGSDIFESYCGAMIATIAMAGSMAADVIDPLGLREDLMFLPLALSSTGLICSIAGIALVHQAGNKQIEVLLKYDVLGFLAKPLMELKLNASEKPELALRIGTLGASILFILTSFLVVAGMGISLKVALAVLAGAAGGVIIGLVTEYYTASKPVHRIAESGETGPATVMITGLAVGMESVVVPVVTICAVILISSSLVGLYGVGIAAVGMLATVGITMAIDAYGPIADNAGGIAEMAGLGAKTRAITDSLDEVGNTTAAIGKGFAIGAAALAALAIITAYVETVSVRIEDFQLNLNNSDVLIGLFIGGMLPYLITAITMTAVGDAAFEMIKEIRRQFREIPGLLEANADPDTATCIDIATKAALKKMILPGVIAIAAPPVVGFILGPEALGGMLGGALLSCVLLALMMANAGGAWDNAKKYIEKGHHGGRGSEAHKSAVVGDTVGDPFKDTAGPSMNILINVMAIVSLVIAPLLG
ncbi:V-type H(+)-translocating pyrophosphatase [Methylobacter sp.]|uniref:V-type H(+)-translocating pyrophosphatase n=1 Tax=Methylobacter sp. TaxID=2051955 RepID=UPI003DA4F8BF